MTVKQLAERLSVNVKQLDFEIKGPCQYCSKCGGTERMKCCGCTVTAEITVDSAEPKSSGF
jgi:hypothetical protein